MKLVRSGALWVVAARVVVALGVLVPLARASAADAPPAPPPRISFEISTGSTTGTYFPVGQRLAQLLSHPPGLGRCETADVCGPAGLIVTTRASEGSVANVLAVNSGMISSGLAQADVVAQAIAGQGPFRKSGPARELRVIAGLYGEDVHLLASKESKIANVADLKGKRVSLSTEGSGTILTARSVIAAYRLTEKTITPNYDPADKAIELLQTGQIDAMFFVGGAPAALIQQAIDQGVAVLVPIDGAGRQRLLMRDPYLSAHVIPEGAYGMTPAVETVSVDALWITDSSQPEALIYAMAKALYNPANRPGLDAERVGAHFLDPMFAASTPAPYHPGALRYFIESGIVKPPSEKASLMPPPTPRRS